jgi:beta-lactamase regulating signal transducer with metallopeptidase domain
MEAVFLAVLDLSVKGGIAIGAVLLVRSLLSRWLPGPWRPALWGIVLLRLSLPVAPESRLSVWRLLSDPEAAAGQVSAASGEGRAVRARDVPGSAVQAGSRISLAAVGAAVWMAGGLIFGTRLLTAHRRLGKRVRSFKAVRDPQLTGTFDRCREALGIRRPVQLLEAPDLAGPATFGILRPAILLPPGLIESFGPAEQRGVLLHELAHVRRRDGLLLLVAELLRAVHWFNPLVHLAVRLLRFDLELSCDAVALAKMPPGESRSYGLALVHVLETMGRRTPVALLQSTVESEPQLRRRMAMIARFAPHGRVKDIVFLGGLLVLSGPLLTDPPASRANAGLETKPALLETSWPFEGRDYDFKAEITPLPGTPATYLWNITFNDGETHQRITRSSLITNSQDGGSIKIGESKEGYTLVSLAIDEKASVATALVQVFQAGREVFARRESVPVARLEDEGQPLLPAQPEDRTRPVRPGLPDGAVFRVDSGDADEPVTFDLKLEGDVPDEQKVLRGEQTPFEIDLRSTEIRITACKVSGEGPMLTKLVERSRGKEREVAGAEESPIRYFRRPSQRSAGPPDEPDPCGE